LTLNIDVQQTVREVALSHPAATRVFEKLGIDYCCGGGKSLTQACGVANVEVQNVIDQLNAAEAAAEARHESVATQWTTAPLADLIAHINATHHVFVREEIARLGPLFEKVCRVHGERHPELLEIRAAFQSLSQELTTHMMKEEHVLFPYIERMEEAMVAGDPVIPAPFGTVNNPVSMMEHEHENAGSLLRQMRARSDAYVPPPQACTSYKALYSALEEFERDLHQHIHLENNILFPRAVELEKKAFKSVLS
jgi:regulator of cell morphogenesis and NO signaling